MDTICAEIPLGYLEFTSTVISTVTWPLVVLVVVLVFRDSLIGVFRSITKVRVRDLELEFDRLNEAASRVGEISPAPAEAKPPAFISLEDQLRELVRSAPAAAVLLAWTLVESSLSRSVARLSVSPESPSYRSPLHNLEQLRTYAGLSDEMYQMINELRQLRNRIAHDPEAQQSVSVPDAQLYVQPAQRAIAILEGLTRS